MLKRQRRLRDMEKAKKNASKKLPPKGGTSGNSARAKVQRGMTRDAMAKNQLTNFARGVKRMIKQGAAQDKLNKAAEGTKGKTVRTGRAAAGKLAKTKNAKPAAPAGKLAKRGGLVKSDIQRVKVKDLGPTPKKAVKGGSQKALKAGNKGGALAKKAGSLAGKAGKLLGAAGSALAIGDEIQKIKDVNKYTFGRVGKDPKLSSKATAPNRAERGGRSGPKKVGYPVQKGKVSPKKVKYPTAAETKAASKPPSKPKKASVSKPASKVPAKVSKTPSKSLEKRFPGASVNDGKGGSSPAPKKKLSRLDEALKWASDEKNKDAWMGKKKKKK